MRTSNSPCKITLSAPRSRFPREVLEHETLEMGNCPFSAGKKGQKGFL